MHCYIYTIYIYLLFLYMSCGCSCCCCCCRACSVAHEPRCGNLSSFKLNLRLCFRCGFISSSLFPFYWKILYCFPYSLAKNNKQSREKDREREERQTESARSAIWPVNLVALCKCNFYFSSKGCSTINYGKNAI